MSQTKQPLIKRRLRVVPRLSEIDMVGVVYNVHHFKWFDEARFAIISEMISIDEIVKTGITFMIAENHCVYKNYAIYGDPLIITTTHRLQSSYQGRFEFSHSIMHETRKVEIASGSSSMVAVDLKTKQLIKELPDFMWERYQNIR